jgi:transcription initiation factor IIF auxiliary subunit
MNTSHSGDVKDAASEEKRYQIYVRDLAKTFDWFKSSSSSSSSNQHTRTVNGKVTSSSSSQHIRTVNGKVTSSKITNNNPGTDFINQLKQFENNEDMSEQNIIDKDFYYNEMVKSQGI